jgi:Ni/Co efflux regulator RcnB
MKRLIAAALALTLIGGVVTTAQADNRDRDRHERRHDRDDDRRHDRYDHRRDDRRDWDRRDWRRRDWDRHYGFRHYDGRRYRGVYYVRPSGYYYRSWRYGDYLPRSYYARRYIVNDYHVYRLRPPPRGYHWVRVDNDVVLAAIASGIVVSAVYGIFH